MPLFVAQALALAPLGGIALWMAVDAARGRPRREALHRVLRELAAALGASAGGDETAVELHGRLVSIRLVQGPGLRETLVIAIGTDDGSAPVAPAGYRARPQADVTGRPWFRLARRRGAAVRGQWITMSSSATLWARTDASGRDAARVFASAKLREALSAVFTETDADRVDVNDGAATVAASLRAPRPEQINPFTIGELAAALADVAAALPSFDGPAHERARLDASHALVVPALALALMAPFAPGTALDFRPPLSSPTALLLAGAGAGAALAFVAARLLLRLARGWPPARRRAHVALAALVLALPVHGAGLAVALNGLGGDLTMYQEVTVSQRASPGPFGGPRWNVTIPEKLGKPGSGRAATVRDLWIGDGASPCPEHTMAAFHLGWFGVEWLDHVYCLPLPPAPEPLRRPRAHRQLAAPLGVAHQGVVPGKPPLSDHLVDIRLRNDASERRWFLLPDALDGPPTEALGIDRIVVSVFGGLGRVPVVKLGRVNALLLPAGGDVIVQDYRMSSHWRSQPGHCTVVVLVAREVLWDGQRLATFLDESALASASAVVSDCESVKAGCRHIGVHQAGDGGSTPLLLAYVDVERLETELELDTHSPFE